MGGVARPRWRCSEPEKQRTGDIRTSICLLVVVDGNVRHCAAQLHFCVDVRGRDCKSDEVELISIILMR